MKASGIEGWKKKSNPLPNLFSNAASLAVKAAPVSLRPLWAYGFDSASPRTLEKSKVGKKEKLFSFNQLYFLKGYK